MTGRSFLLRALKRGILPAAQGCGAHFPVAPPLVEADVTPFARGGRSAAFGLGDPEAAQALPIDSIFENCAGLSVKKRLGASR